MNLLIKRRNIILLSHSKKMFLEVRVMIWWHLMIIIIYILLPILKPQYKVNVRATKNNHIKRRLKNKNSWDSHYISNIKSIMSNGEIMICWRVFLPWSESHLLLLRYLSHISLTNLIVRIWCVRIQLAWCEYNSWKLFRPSDHHCDNRISCDISAIQKLALCILERFQ